MRAKDRIKWLTEEELPKDLKHLLKPSKSTSTHFSRHHTESRQHNQTVNQREICTTGTNVHCSPSPTLNNFPQMNPEGIVKQCNMKLCVINKMQSRQMKTELSVAVEERDRYKKLLNTQHMKMGHKIRQFEIITRELGNKHEKQTQREIELDLRLKLIENLESQLTQMQYSLEEEEKQMKEREKQCNYELDKTKQYTQQMKNDQIQLECDVGELKELQERLQNSVNYYQSQEVALLESIKKLQEYIQNSEIHFQNISELEQRLREKCIVLETLQPSLIKHSEEQDLLCERNYLNGLGHNLNEEILVKRIESNVKEKVEKFKTQRTEENEQNFKHSQFQYYNGYQSTECVPDYNNNTPTERRSFKRFKKPQEIRSNSNRDTY